VSQGQKTARYWAGLSPKTAIAELDSSEHGLSLPEVIRRLEHHGPNVLPRAPRRPWPLELAANFVHLFAVLLWIAAALAWVSSMPELAWAIVAVIIVNGLFSYWQEYRAGREIEALVRLLPRQVMVRRNGEVTLVASEEIAPGDLLVLSEGELVPADARLLTAERLRLDVSSLTGESRLVTRSADAANGDDYVDVMLPNLVFAGTSVASGRGEAVVFATGPSTEFGRIARLTQAEVEPPSPLEREIVWITRLVTLLSLGMGIGFFALGRFFGGLSGSAAFVFALGIIVANVPEGLLPTLTLSLALAVRRMASRRALVKRLSAIETLGATTLILTDKTGTLTENEMTVREVRTAAAGYRLGGVGYDPSGGVEPILRGEEDPTGLEELLRIGALCCDAHLVARGEAHARWETIGDPTEGAILVAASKIGLGNGALRAYPRVTELPFDSSRKRMTTVQRIGGRNVACVKGAAGEIFSRCSTAFVRGAVLAFDERRRAEAEAANHGLTGRGFRVLAVARRNLDPGEAGKEGSSAEAVEQQLTFLGLLAMEDPPRLEVPAAVAACREAGIRLVMVTGDDPRTAAAIAREIGMLREEARVLTGVELESLDDGALGSVLDDPNLLFARITPDQKLRLVEAYRRRGEVVAVTGDGVNDAPALKRADVGIAMGVTGTDVAREAADVVLADDNFASIAAAIEEGRAVYDNIRKFVTYIFASNIPEIVPFIVFVLARVPLPLTVMQILAVDLGTDLFPALALGVEPPERDAMRRPPRRRSERLLTRAMLLRAYAWLGLVEAALSLGAYFFAFWLVGWPNPLPASGALYGTATTMSLAAIVAAQVGNAFVCRSERQSSLALGFTSNRALLAGIGAEIAVLCMLIYVPPLARLFALQRLGPVHWIALASLPFVMVAAEEMRKAIMREFARAVVPPAKGAINGHGRPFA
jgi:P-type Ca2+ transporter type 2C